MKFIILILFILITACHDTHLSENNEMPCTSLTTEESDFFSIAEIACPEAIHLPEVFFDYSENSATLSCEPNASTENGYTLLSCTPGEMNENYITFCVEGEVHLADADDLDTPSMECQEIHISCTEHLEFSCRQ